ncbi:MAG: DedA family protein [Desulfomonilaceae bacterium]
MEQTILQWVSEYGYMGIFFLLMFGIIGLPIPDETLMTFLGYLVFRGQLHVVPTIASAFFGSICGITVSYLLGRSGGYMLIGRYGHLIQITPERMDKVHEWLEQRGRWGLFFGYFVPGVRHLTALAAGTSRIRYSVFARFAYSGGFVWSASLIVAGFLLGKGWSEASGPILRGSLIAASVVVSVLVVYYLLQRKAGRKD